MDAQNKLQASSNLRPGLSVHAMRVSVFAVRLLASRPHPFPAAHRLAVLRRFVASGAGSKHTALLQCLASQVMVATQCTASL